MNLISHPLIKGNVVKKAIIFKFLWFLCLIPTLLFIGCDFSSSSSSSSGGENEINCKVQRKSNVQFKSGDVFMYDCGSYRVFVTESTKSLIRGRSSCSGFDDVAPDGFENGDTLFVNFKKDNIDYAKDPTEVRASSIEGYPSECVGGYTPPDGNGCDTCPDSFFD
jgi:hypothetical protein